MMLELLPAVSAKKENLHVLSKGNLVLRAEADLGCRLGSIGDQNWNIYYIFSWCSSLSHCKMSDESNLFQKPVPLLECVGLHQELLKETT